MKVKNPLSFDIHDYKLLNKECFNFIGHSIIQICGPVAKNVRLYFYRDKIMDNELMLNDDEQNYPFIDENLKIKL